MKLKKGLGLVLLMSAMMLAACNGPKPAPSSNPSGSEPSQQSDSGSGSSQGGGGQSSGGGDQSSGGGDQSSGGGESSQGSEDSSAVSTDPAVTVSAVTIAKKENNIVLQINGTSANIAAADFVWALALEHTGTNSGGDGKEGYILGGAEFAAEDYVLPATLNADGSFAFEYDLSALATMEAGSYFINAGVKGLATAVSIGNTKPDIELTDANYRFYFRNDIGQRLTICADELPPLHLTDATIVKEDGKIYAKIGGEVSSSAITQAVLDTYQSFVQFQNTSNWGLTKLTADDYSWKLEGNKAFLYADVTFFTAGGNYNTHLNVKDPNTQANCKMETNIDEHYNVQKDENTWLDIEVFSDLTASGSDQSKFWGNLGFKVKNGVDPDAPVVHTHTFGDAQTKIGNLTPYVCSSCGAKAYALDFADTNPAVSASKLKTDAIWDVTGLPAGKYEVQLYACAASTTLPQNVRTGNNADEVGRYQFRFGEGDYVDPNPNTYDDLGLGTGEDASHCQWSKGFCVLTAENGVARFEIHWTDKGYSCFIGAVRLVQVIE